MPFEKEISAKRLHRFNIWSGNRIKDKVAKVRIAIEIE